MSVRLAKYINDELKEQGLDIQARFVSGGREDLDKIELLGKDGNPNIWVEVGSKWVEVHRKDPYTGAVSKSVMLGIQEIEEIASKIKQKLLEVVPE
jgi:hypothetical protein